MRDAINEAKHTLELLHDDLERGSNVHPDTITNLEADIQKYDLQDR
jgi:hypothetical protein